MSRWVVRQLSTEDNMDLILPLKREYFEQIKAGTKTEEFRLVNDYWIARLCFKNYQCIVLTLGYPKRSDIERRMVVPYKGYTIKQITHPHFGIDQVHVFALDVTHNVKLTSSPLIEGENSNEIRA